MAGSGGSMGRARFAERCGLWTDERREAAARVAAQAAEAGLSTIRIGFADQHGIVRGKTIMAGALGDAMHSGVSMTTTLLAKDTAHRTIYPVWKSGGGFDMAEMTGAGDFVMLPDPATFRVLPWAPGTGWLLSDIYFPTGAEVPFSTRRLLGAVTDDLAKAGYELITGLEIEFHIFRLLDMKERPEDAGQPGAAPEVSLLNHGFQYLTELRVDALEPVLEILRADLAALGLEPRTMEVEFGPSQVEFTFEPMEAREAADAMVLFRGAVKQICRRHGYHATFMCRPGLANIFSSGWHLHQSLRDRATGANAFVPDDDTSLSPLGRAWAAGLLAHAHAASVFTTPTINGYKRYRPFTLAPDRAVWSNDNRGAMVRALGGPGDGGSRVENRVGEPAANPYLYIASQIVSGMDGVARGLDPGEPADAPYDADAALLPKSLMEAVGALGADHLFREKFGAEFIDYILTLKQAEIARFLSEVTDWEHREYFEQF
jgi:glutamine synthetase